MKEAQPGTFTIVGKQRLLKKVGGRGCRGHRGCRESKVWKIMTEDLGDIQVLEFSFTCIGCFEKYCFGRIMKYQIEI